MTRGSRKNLKHFNVDPDGLVVADARVPPLTKVDCLVTDPPYGRSATTMKSTTRQIVEAVLFASKGMLREGQRICIALPIKVNGDHIEQLSKEIAEFANGLDFRCLESHKVYVHRTLTREILVYEKRHGLRAVNRF